MKIRAVKVELSYVLYLYPNILNVNHGTKLSGKECRSDKLFVEEKKSSEGENSHCHHYLFPSEVFFFSKM